MKIVGAILAGGLGRRMPGFDKPLAPLAGKPLIAHVIARLAAQTAEIILNANTDPDRFNAFGLDVVADRIEGFRGPLAGIQTLMQAGLDRGVSHVLVVPADTPFLPADLASRLWSADPERTTVRIACSLGRRHPVVGLWPAALSGDLATHLSRTDDLSLQAYLRQVATVEVDFPAASLPGTAETFDPFFNVNEPSDLEQAERLLAQSANRTG